MLLTDHTQRMAKNLRLIVAPVRQYVQDSYEKQVAADPEPIDEFYDGPPRRTPAWMNLLGLQIHQALRELDQTGLAAPGDQSSPHVDNSHLPALETLARESLEMTLAAHTDVQAAGYIGDLLRERFGLRDQSYVDSVQLGQTWLTEVKQAAWNVLVEVRHRRDAEAQQ